MCCSKYFVFIETKFKTDELTYVKPAARITSEYWKEIHDYFSSHLFHTATR